ncbi:hypothetical protein ACHAPO_011997 [Fusarium lateritium]
MSGLEIPSFIVGLSGLIAVFEKGFHVWRIIRKASDFGDDTAAWLCKLEMEFFRFQTWWAALDHLADKKIPSQSLRDVPLPTSPLQVKLGNKEFGKIVINAATSVLQLLRDIERVLQSNGVLSVMEAQPATANPSADLGEETEKARQRLKQLAVKFLKHTSWTARIKHSASPWKQDSDKTTLDQLLDSIIYWNTRLYSILPQPIQDSILEVGIAGYALDSDNVKDVANLTTNRNNALSQSAKLIEIRKKFKDVNLGIDEALLKQMELKEDGFEGLIPSSIGQYTITEYTSESGEFSRVFIEWVPIPKGDFDSYKLAHGRMSRLSYTLHQVKHFSAFQPLPALGFFEFSSAKSFGLVWTLSRGITSSTKVSTLHEILKGPASKKSGQIVVRDPLPSLNQRLQLASKLTMAFYTFLLTRWHHERFNSLHIAFLLDGAKDKTKPIDLSDPIIGGFAISRPDLPTELSISASVEEDEAIYLHPDIRERLKPGSNVTEENKPRYQRVHDIYAVGLLLAEVGFWQPLSRIAESGLKGVKAISMRPEQFKDAVVKKCESDLACWAGEIYRDVTLRCLLAGKPGGVQGEDNVEGLNNFYWDVGIELLNS